MSPRWHTAGCRAIATVGASSTIPLRLLLAAHAVREDTAFEEGVELVLDELWQMGIGLGLREEGRGVLLDQALQRGLFRVVALVSDRGAI